MIFEILKNKVDSYIEHNSDLLDDFSNDVKQGSGFMLFSLSNIFKNFDIDDILDGVVDASFRKVNHDYSIDAIYLTADGEIINSDDDFDNYDEDTKFCYHIMQFKKGTGIGQDDLLKYKEGIDEVFVKSNCNEESNTYLYSKLDVLSHYKEKLYFTHFPSENIKVLIYLVFGGLKNNIDSNDLLTKQVKDISDLLTSKGFLNNSVEIIDAQKLIDLEKKTDEIVDLLKYQTTFKYITEVEKNKKLNGYICIVNGNEIAKLVDTWKSGLFEANIRDFYKRNPLNSKIFETSTNSDEAKYFWSFNNGLTITCKRLEELPDNNYRLHGLQIVNGCQTSNAIFRAYHNKKRHEYLSQISPEKLTKKQKKEIESIDNKFLNQQTTLLVKIIETNDNDLIYKITEKTNSQTPIKSFSLKANDDVQLNIEQYFLQHGLYYERRVNFYKNQGKKSPISIQHLFQLYVSQILIKPSQVKTRPAGMFSSMYDNVFPSPTVKLMNADLYLIPVLIDLKLSKYIRKIDKSYLESDPYKRVLIANGKLHLGCFILSSIIGAYGEREIIANVKTIKDSINDDSTFKNHFENGLENFKKQLQLFAGQKKESIPMALRKTDFDERLIRFIKTSKKYGT